MNGLKLFLSATFSWGEPTEADSGFICEEETPVHFEFWECLLFCVWVCTCVFVLLNPHDRKESEWIPVCLRPNLEVVSCVLSNLLPLSLEPEMSRTQALTDPPQPLLIGPGKTGNYRHSVGSHGAGRENMNGLSVNCVHTVMFGGKSTGQRLMSMIVRWRSSKRSKKNDLHLEEVDSFFFEQQKLWQKWKEACNHL